MSIAEAAHTNFGDLHEEGSNDRCRNDPYPSSRFPLRREKTETPRKAQVDTHSPDLVRHRRDRSPQPFVKSKDRRRPPIQRPTDGSCNPPRGSRGDVSAGVLKVPRQIIEPRLWSGGAPRRHATDATGPAVVSQPSSAAYAACVEADGPMPSSSRSSTRKCSYTRNASAVLPSAESARMRSPAAAYASSRRSRDRARCRPHCQRPTIENTNGILRRRLTKGTNLSVHSRTDLDRIEFNINMMPRCIFNGKLALHKFDIYRILR